MEFSHQKVSKLFAKTVLANAIASEPTKTALVAHISKNKKVKHDFVEKAEILKKVRNKALLKIHEANQNMLHEDLVLNFKKDPKTCKIRKKTSACKPHQ